jgi:hypothetical protein
MRGLVAPGLVEADVAVCGHLAGRIATTSRGRAPLRCCCWTIAAAEGERWGTSVWIDAVL